MSNSLLAKLTPNSISLLRFNGGSVPDITAFDVAGALSYGDLSKYAYFFGLAKYCMDERSIEKLVVHLKEKIQRSIDDNKWQDSKGRALRLAGMILQEAGFGIVCKRCRGSGVIKKNAGEGVSKIEVCPRCGGRGVVNYSERERAHLSGIPKSTWCRTWSYRVQEFYSYVGSLDDSVNRHLKSQFR